MARAAPRAAGPHRPRGLALGTIHGARCLGRADDIGSIEPGKLADIALWRVDDAGHAGLADPVATLVMGPPRRVDTLLVGGRVVVEGGHHTSLDEREIAAQARRASERLAA